MSKLRTTVARSLETLSENGEFTWYEKFTKSKRNVSGNIRISQSKLRQGNVIQARRWPSLLLPALVPAKNEGEKTQSQMCHFHHMQKIIRQPHVVTSAQSGHFTHFHFQLTGNANSSNSNHYCIPCFALKSVLWFFVREIVVFLWGASLFPFTHIILEQLTHLFMPARSLLRMLSCILLILSFACTRTPFAGCLQWFCLSVSSIH